MKESDLSLIKTATLGCFPGWAMYPLRKKLQKLDARISLRVADKSTLQKMLQSSELAMAPCSSICLLKNPHFDLALPLGVAVKGSSGGTYIGFSNTSSKISEITQRRINVLRDIFMHANVKKTKNIGHATQFIMRCLNELPDLDFKHAPLVRMGKGSTSEVMLGKVLYRLLFGQAAYENNERINSVANGSMAAYGPLAGELRSGDDALQKRCQYLRMIDLEDIWYQLTSLPFVYSVWQKNSQKLSLQLKNKILKGAELVQASMKVEPTAHFPDIRPTNQSDQCIDLAGYWKNIYYRLGPQEMRGMLLFLNLAYQLEKKSLRDDLLTVKMIRMEQRDLSVQHFM